MINEELLDFTNENLLDSNIVGKRRNFSRSRRGRSGQRFSNGSGDVDYGAIATATAGLASTIASRQPNVAKQQARAAKKDLKTVCGRKPLLKKKRGQWDKCVADYMKTKQPTTTPAESSETYKSSSAPTQDYSQGSDSGKNTEKKFLGMPQTTGIIVTLVAVSVIGFVGYKMFFKKGAVTATAPTVTG